MALLLETSVGDLVIDFFIYDCPITCKNLLKLCKIKFYNNSLLFCLKQNFIAQIIDRKCKRNDKYSIYGMVYGKQSLFFDDELRHIFRHTKRGIVAMASRGKDCNDSIFYFTLPEFSLESLNKKHTIFGEISEGLDSLNRINNSVVDSDHRSLQNILIKNIFVIEDPFSDMPGIFDHILSELYRSTHYNDSCFEVEWKSLNDIQLQNDLEDEILRKEAKNKATVLEIVGGLPNAKLQPPNTVLFVCKLNSVTTEDSLEIIFSQCGTVVSSDIIKDSNTENSLNYGFIGFENDEACQKAYFKMNNMIIDKRRIKVDFSQSVTYLWKHFKRNKL